MAQSQGQLKQTGHVTLTDPAGQLVLHERLLWSAGFVAGDATSVSVRLLLAGLVRTRWSGYPVIL